MPRRRLPPRLWLEPERRNAAGAITHGGWVIRDGKKKIGTGCGADDHRGAAQALERYLSAAHAEKPLAKNKRADEVLIADVVRHYVTARGDELAGAELVALRFDNLMKFWGEMTLDAIDSATCKAYVDWRAPSTGGARRELEDLRSAVNLAVADKLCRDAVKVTLPQKPGARTEFLERDAVARLVWHAYRKREIQTIHRGPRKGEKVATRRRPMRHIARFILFGLYTGTRSGRIWRASFERREGHPWIDVDGGVFYREAPGETASRTKRAPSIRIPGRLLAHLRRWQEGGGDPAAATTFLCEYHKGRPGDPKKGFRRLVDDVLGEEGEEIVRHSLRHTAATWLLQGAEDPHAVAGFLGMRTDTLISVYGHHHPDYQESIGDAFTSGRAGRRPKPPAARRRTQDA
ncbi:tyrosine-type recombinase/integrase [Antarcticirhabdus aurantiaca]|uniref:tyrosine-type recombinase/integrase n=1 Tax=Antarcticirhabdus aurantiaca TaxID=2606717 RepID=UPI00131A9EC2|nr:tyrosine-type recombinase/integrase [Antarcticirhabdus aurantiaca]